MTNEAMKIRAMLGVLRSQLRSDLSDMAEDVLQQRIGTRREISQDIADVRDFNIEHLKTELALRTMAYRYTLLNRIDEALGPRDEAACVLPQCAVAQGAASHDAVAV